MKNLNQDHEEKVLSQEKLEDFRQVYLNQLEQSPTAFLIHEGRKCKYINPSAMKLLKVTCKSELIGKPIWNFIDSQYRETIEQRITDTNNGLTPSSMEQIWYTNEGLPIVVEVTSLPSVWGDSLSTQVIIRDVTNKKKLECEKNQMKQVFINVMKNAIEAMPNGGTFKIRGQVKEFVSYQLTFEDTGTGIDEHRLKKLGTPFFTTKEKGIGLGLTISNKIITDHKGQFKMESEIGKGTRVMIILKK